MTDPGPLSAGEFAQGAQYPKTKAEREREDLLEGLKNAGMTEAEALAELRRLADEKKVAEKLRAIERTRAPRMGQWTEYRNPGPCVDPVGHNFRAADNRINISVCSRCGKQVDW